MSRTSKPEDREGEPKDLDGLNEIFAESCAYVSLRAGPRLAKLAAMRDLFRLDADEDGPRSDREGESQ